MTAAHHYRAYHLSRDGRIASTEIIEAAGDETALRLLFEMKNGHGIELWDRQRFVGKALPYGADIVKVGQKIEA